MHTSKDAPPPPPKHPPRREYERVSFEVEVSLKSDHNFYTGWSNNISEGGIFVATDQMARAGETFWIAFSMPGDEAPVRVCAEVRWRREPNPYNNVPAGLGMQFTDLDDSMKKRIDAFIESRRESIFYVN